jgi:hypothetical protein
MSGVENKSSAPVNTVNYRNPAIQNGTGTGSEEGPITPNHAADESALAGLGQLNRQRSGSRGRPTVSLNPELVHLRPQNNSTHETRGPFYPGYGDAGHVPENIVDVRWAFALQDLQSRDPADRGYTLEQFAQFRGVPSNEIRWRAREHRESQNTCCLIL